MGVYSFFGICDECVRLVEQEVDTPARCSQGSRVGVGLLLTWRGAEGCLCLEGSACIVRGQWSWGADPPADPDKASSHERQVVARCLTYLVTREASQWPLDIALPRLVF